MCHPNLLWWMGAVLTVKLVAVPFLIRKNYLMVTNCEKLTRGGSKPGGFPLFSGKVQIVSRTLSGLFLVGALNRPRKRKGTNRENPRRENPLTIPEQTGKIPKKSGKSQKRKDKSRSGNPPPRLQPPGLRALETSGNQNETSLFEANPVNLWGSEGLGTNIHSLDAFWRDSFPKIEAAILRSKSRNLMAHRGWKTAHEAK